VALRKTRPHFAAQVVFDSVGHKDRAAFALEMGGVKLGGAQYGFIERRQLGKFPIGRGKVLKESDATIVVPLIFSWVTARSTSKS
jgi:hypothetical protein